ncbi:MAG: threonylcarbamoyl-AMP synthase [Armatimonadetes bacterium]|nr:threonylcarbamoyl-AMP synthase [Armatimonadota bacterium]
MSEDTVSTRVLRTSELSASEIAAAAVQALSEGKLVALPTDTVYGLAAKATDEAAIGRLFEVKQRSGDNPLPVLIADPEQVNTTARQIPSLAHRLAERFWPGPLTLILHKSAAISDLVTAGQPTVGLRVPDHELTRSVLRQADFAVAVTSANLSGQPEAVLPRQVLTTFGGLLDLLIDDGPCPGGLPSTVLDLTVSPPQILRDGPISRQQLEQTTGQVK